MGRVEKVPTFLKDALEDKTARVVFLSLAFWLIMIYWAEGRASQPKFARENQSQPVITVTKTPSRVATKPPERIKSPTVVSPSPSKAMVARTVQATPSSLPRRASPIFKTPTRSGSKSKTKTAPWPVGVVEAEVLNVRRGPGVEWEAFAQVHQGATLRIKGRDFSGKWLQVLTSSGSEGWLSRKYIKVQGDLDRVPVVKAPAPVPPGVFYGRFVKFEWVEKGRMLIRGKVFDKYGRGIPGVRVKIQAWDWWAVAVTNGEGQYAFDGLSNPVVYTLSLPDRPCRPYKVRGEWNKLLWVNFYQAP